MAAFALLVFVAVSSSLFAVRLNQVAKAEKEAGDEAREARTKLQAALNDNDRLLARSYIDKAQALCEDGEIAAGMLWLTRALSTAPKESKELRAAIRNGLSAWHERLPTLRLLLEQEESIHAIALSLDGRRLYTGSPSGTVIAYDAMSGHPLAQSTDHQGGILWIAISPDDKYVVTTSRDGTARLRDSHTLAAVGDPIDYSEGNGANWSVNCALFSPDGEQIITGGGVGYGRGKMIVWDTETRRTSKTMRFDGGGVFKVQPTAQGLLALLRKRNTYQLWNVDTDEAVSPIVERGNTLSLAVSPDGSRFAAAGYGSTIKVWEARTGELINSFNSSGIIFSMEFTEDGTQMLSAGLDQAARLWDVATGRVVSMPLRHQDPVRIAAFNHDRTKILTGTGERLRGAANGTARIWDMALEQPDVRSIEHADEICTVLFSPQGLRVLTRKSGQGYQLRDAESMLPIGQPLVEDCNWIGSIAFNADGSRFSINGAGGSNTTVEGLQVRNTATGELIAKTKKEFASVAMAFSPDGRYLLTGGQSGEVNLREADTLNRVGEPIVLPQSVSSVLFTPDGKRFITGCFDGTVRVWDVATLAQVDEPIRHVSEVKSLAHHPTRPHVLVGCADGSARVWDLQKRVAVGPSLQHKSVVCDVKFSADGSLAITCSTDGVTGIWDSTTLGPVGPPIVHSSGWPRVSLSADGQQLASTNGQVWTISRPPIPGSAEAGQKWAELVTGWVLDESGQINILSAESWATERDRLIKKQLEFPGLPTHDEYSQADVLHSPSHRYLGAKALLEGAWDDAVTQFDRVIAESPEVWHDYVLRGRALAASNRSQQAEEDYEKAIRLAPENTAAQLERGMFHLETDRIEQAAADFANVVASRADGGTWLMSDCWINGPHPGGLEMRDPFSSVRDATHLVCRTDDNNEGQGLKWRRASQNLFAGDLSHYLRLDQTENSVMYVLVYVYSDQDQNVTLFLGYDDAAIVWFNDQEVRRSEFAFGTLPDQDLVPVILKAGWNRLLAKVANNGGEFNLFARISEDPSDRWFAEAVAQADQGHWRQAGENLVEACRLCDDRLTLVRRLTSRRWANQRPRSTNTPSIL